jgi:hypothetical protein
MSFRFFSPREPTQFGQRKSRLLENGLWQGLTGKTAFWALRPMFSRRFWDVFWRLAKHTDTIRGRFYPESATLVGVADRLAKAFGDEIATSGISKKSELSAVIMAAG